MANKDVRQNILSEKRAQWMASLSDDLPVQDRFRLRDKTAVVKLKPHDVADKIALREQLDDFIDRLNKMSAETEGISPANAIPVEPNPNLHPRMFYGGAFLLADGVEEPPVSPP